MIAVVLPSFIGVPLPGIAQVPPQLDNAPDWSQIEGPLSGSTPQDWGYGRREGRNFTVFLSEPACARWAKTPNHRRLTINGTAAPRYSRACHEGVNKAVLVGYFPLPLPPDCCTSNRSAEGQRPDRAAIRPLSLQNLPTTP